MTRPYSQDFSSHSKPENVPRGTAQGVHLQSLFHPAFHVMEIIFTPTLQMSKLSLIEPVPNARLVALKAQL